MSPPPPALGTWGGLPASGVAGGVSPVQGSPHDLSPPAQPGQWAPTPAWPHRGLPSKSAPSRKHPLTIQKISAPSELLRRTRTPSCGMLYPVLCVRLYLSPYFAAPAPRGRRLCCLFVAIIQLAPEEALSSVALFGFGCLAELFSCNLIG